MTLAAALGLALLIGLAAMLATLLGPDDTARPPYDLPPPEFDERGRIEPLFEESRHE